MLFVISCLCYGVILSPPRVTLYECLYFDDGASTLFCVIASWPILFGGKNIMQVQDAFKIGQELVSVIFCVTVIAGACHTQKSCGHMDRLGMT